MYINMSISVYIYIYISIYLSIYIYIYRERERYDVHTYTHTGSTGGMHALTTKGGVWELDAWVHVVVPDAVLRYTNIL